MGGEGKGELLMVSVSESKGGVSNKEIGVEEGGVCLWKDTSRKSGGLVFGPGGSSRKGGGSVTLLEGANKWEGSLAKHI